MSERSIAIARDFSRQPGGRYVSDGAFSGEEFREKLLWPAFQKANLTGERLKILLDGTDGYAASFLEEAFGGLVRKYKIQPNMLLETLDIETHDPLYVVYKILAEKYIADAEAALQREAK